MGNKILYTAAAAFTLLLSSCGAWLDETASSEIRAGDHYKTPQGYKQSLMGCYTLMAEPDFYGKYLTWHLPEILARHFVLSQIGYNDNAFEAYVQRYNYTSTYTEKQLESIWSKGYNIIANANYALGYARANGRSVMDETTYNLIYGELHAIRAIAHFELLKLYGYGNWSGRATELDNKPTLPYVTELSTGLAPQQKGADFIDMLLDDIETALEHLRLSDPVLGIYDKDHYEGLDSDGFFGNRFKRLNYLAVQALKCRVLMWRARPADFDTAAVIANEVITAARESGRDLKGVLNINGDPHQINEALFAINIIDMTDKISAYINPSIMSSSVSYLNMYMDYDLVTAYYNLDQSEYTTDFRYTNMVTVASGTFYVPTKAYQNSSMSGTVSYNLLGVIRIPELYYMGAECALRGTTPDLDAARLSLAQVLDDRGVTVDITSYTADDILLELEKEYRKEFISEGHDYFYRKRTGKTSLLQYEDEVDDSIYLLPYPYAEREAGRVQ